MREADRHPGIHIDEAPVSSLLLQVVRAHALLATELLAEIGVVPPQEIVLLYLDQHGPSPQREIVRFMGRDRSTVTHTLQALERHGLVQREASKDDRRALVVALTAKGRELVPQVRRTWAAIEATTFGGLSPEQLDALVKALGSVRAELLGALKKRSEGS